MTEFCLDVRGDYACFTRPEFKVERVSYEVPTPSAARSIFESILWKPAIEWRVRRIEVLSPIRWLSVRRNEVATKLAPRTVSVAMVGGAPPVLYVEDDRQQRAALILRDVRYRLHAELRLTPQAFTDTSLAKHAEMFRRRATKGQCVNQPYLGTREFGCRFRLAEQVDDQLKPIPETRDLGVMLFDLDFWSGSLKPLLYRPRLVNGVIDVPDRESSEVLR